MSFFIDMDSGIPTINPGFRLPIIHKEYRVERQNLIKLITEGEVFTPQLINKIFGKKDKIFGKKNKSLYEQILLAFAKSHHSSSSDEIINLLKKAPHELLKMSEIQYLNFKLN